MKHGAFIVILAAFFLIWPVAGALAGDICLPDAGGDGRAGLPEIIQLLRTMTGQPLAGEAPLPLSGTASLTGLAVQAEDGVGMSAPLPDAEVVALRSDGLVFALMSDGEGRFRFENMPAGRYEVRLYRDGATADPVEVVLSEGGAAEVIMRWWQPPVARLGALEGQVLAPDHEERLQAVPLARLLVLRMPPNMFDIIRGHQPLPVDLVPADCPPRYAESDESGHYRLDDVPAGHYLLMAAKPGFKRALALASVAAGGTVTEDLVMFPLPDKLSAALSGTVSAGTTDGAGLMETPGAPVPGARVTAFPNFPYPTLRPLPLHETVTDVDGRYEFPELPVDYQVNGVATYTVTVEAEGYGTVSRDVVLSPGETTTLDFILAPEAVCTANEACPADSFCARPAGVCEAAGICEVRPEACITLYDPVCGCDGRTYGNDCEAAGAGVSIRHRGECDSLPGPASLEGHVNDGSIVCITAPCLAPLAGARVALTFMRSFQVGLPPVDTNPPDPAPISPLTLITTTDDDGFYRIAEMTPGSYEMHVAKEGYTSIIRKVEIEGGANIVDVDLHPQPQPIPVPSCSDDADCAGNSFCARPVGACGGEGRCTFQPIGCYDLYRPVCGCDGRTYGNDCEDRMAGVSILHEGACEN